jgi:hypothetical protein
MKTTRRLFQWIGVWVAVLPFLGFPTSWKQILSITTGVAIIIISYLYLRRRAIPKTKTEQTFIESAPHSKKNHEEITPSKELYGESTQEL